jgi:hypothetical protein
MLRVKNPSSVQSEDPSGTKYLHKRTGEIQPVKPEMTEIRKDGKTIISIQGDSVNARKLLAKKTDELLSKGYKILEFNMQEVSEVPPLSIEFNFQVTQGIVLEINKIALEYYALSGLDISLLGNLCERVRSLDTSLNNVIFCNWQNEVREFNSKEISHLIVLKKDVTGALFCYIELFNVVCAYIKLLDDFEGDADFLYYQDAITGDKLDWNVEIDIPDNLENRNDKESFGILVNSLIERLREKEFTQVCADTYALIRTELEQEVEKGTLPKADFLRTYTTRCCMALGELSVADFPYMIEDFKDEENSQINFIHSNMPQEVFEKFCEVYQHLTGLKVDFPSEGRFIFEGFLDQPFLKRGKISLIKVYCILKHEETGRKRYIPYRDFFIGLSPTRIESIDLNEK